MSLNYCEIQVKNLEANIQSFKTHFKQANQPNIIIAPTVKSNAYGHGIVISAKAFIRGGADWLCVHHVSEAVILREHQIDVPIYVFGPTGFDELDLIVKYDLRVVVYHLENIQKLENIAESMGRSERIKLHLKLETGNHRQGVEIDEALQLADVIKSSRFLILEGICSHFANVEDTTEHHYAKKQLDRFQEMAKILQAHGHEIKIKHIANSAASILWPDTCMDMVRIGISAYGLWPSKESKVVAQYLGNQIQLKPALQWKTKVMQIKKVGAQQSIGYGCTYTTTHPILLAILPVGYYEGYDRGLSNLAYVLIRGKRAYVRGRICMNITMVEITDIPEVCLEDEVVLLGKQGDEVISAEQVASWANTINYEIVTRIAGHLPRIAVE